MGKQWWKRVTAALGLCVGGVCLLTACLPPGIACPAIGYLSSVEVQVDGEVAFIDACAGAECDTGSGASTLSMSEKVPGTWSVVFHAGTPDELTLEAFDAGGALLAQETFELVWTPVEGYGPCPGPVSTPPLEFSIG